MAHRGLHPTVVFYQYALGYVNWKNSLSTAPLSGWASFVLFSDSTLLIGTVKRILERFFWLAVHLDMIRKDRARQPYTPVHYCTLVLILNTLTLYHMIFVCQVDFLAGCTFIHDPAGSGETNLPNSPDYPSRPSYHPTHSLILP